MITGIEQRLIKLLRWSEKYTKTDMVYLASGGFWLFFEQAAGATFALALAFVFGHFASQDTYGNYKYALSLAAVLSAFSLTGFSTAITQATSRGHEGSLVQGFRINLRWSVPMVLIGFGAALYYYFQGNTFLAIALSIIAVISPLLNSFGLYDSFLIGRREFKRTAFYTVITNALPVIAVIFALFFFGKRAIYLVVTFLVVSTAINGYFYYKSIESAKNNQEDPELLKYTLHLSFMGILGAIADKIDSIAIFTLLGPAPLAVYTYAIAIPDQLKGVVKNMVPLSMAKFAARSITDIKQTIWRRMLYLMAALTIAILCYIIVTPLIFHILFPIYNESIEYSRLYSISIILTAFVSPLISVLQSHKKTKALYIATNAGSILIIIVLPILTFYYGLMGAIVSQLLYRAANAGFATWQFLTLKE